MLLFQYITPTDLQVSFKINDIVAIARSKNSIDYGKVLGVQGDKVSIRYQKMTKMYLSTWMRANGPWEDEIWIQSIIYNFGTNLAMTKEKIKEVKATCHNIFDA